MALPTARPLRTGAPSAPTATGRVVVATDGSAINNPHGPAGWAWYVHDASWAAGGFDRASNQVAELFALLAALRGIPSHPLLVRTDSQFTINVCTKWMPGWKRRGWVKPDGAPPANLPLIQDLDRALTGRDVRFEWVKGHSGDPMNEIADKICGAASSAVRAGTPVITGPGWTGPGTSAATTARPSRPAPHRPHAKTRPAGAATPRRTPTAGPTAAGAPSRQPTFEICGSCDGAIHPLTLHCRCGSM